MARFLAICGSLRSASSNSRLLQAATAVAPAGVDIIPYQRLGSLPLVEILTTMSARVILEATVTLPLGARQLDVAGMLADGGIVTALRAGLSAPPSAGQAAPAVALRTVN